MLGERDKAIQDMKEEKDDLERSIAALQKALKQQEQSTGKPIAFHFLTTGN